MSIIEDIIPLNLEQEKSRFWESEFHINPQFTYTQLTPTKKLAKYGSTNHGTFQKALKILDKAFQLRNELDLKMLAGKVISNQEVEQLCHEFLEMHDLEERVEVVWSASFLSRASVTSHKLKLKADAEYRREDTLGMIYHELGTHLLRRVNYEHQPWYKQKKKHGFSNYLTTEEGLAVAHSLIPASFKLAYKPARYYVANHWASQMSFVELWQKLTPYFADLDARWRACVRQKRGLSDTSQPGCFSKDKVYFEGFLEVLQWLQANNYDLRTLYFGKMALEDATKVVALNPQFNPILPSFFITDPTKYQKEIDAIIQANQV